MASGLFIYIGIMGVVVQLWSVEPELLWGVGSAFVVGSAALTARGDARMGTDTMMAALATLAVSLVAIRMIV